MSGGMEGEPRVLELVPDRPWWNLELGEVWRRRYLCRLLIRKDLLASHKQSVLGPGWFVVQPLVTSLLFAVFFGLFAGLSPRGVPRFLFYLGAMVPWSYFQAVTLGVAGCLVANGSILGKVYFPRLIAPLVASGVATIHFGLNYAVFLGVWAIRVGVGREGGGWSGLAGLPGAVLLMGNVGLLGLGCGLVFASIGVRYRDFRIALPMVLQAWMFATPVIYPAGVVPEKWRGGYFLNPMAGVLEAHRHLFFGTGMPSRWHLAQGAVVTMLLLLGGVFLFNRTQRNFIDVL